MGFHWGADHVSHWPQDIKDGIAMAQAVPNAKMTDEEEHTVPLVNGKTGEPILKFPTASTRRVNRRKLRHLLVRGIDVRFGKKLVRIDDHGSTLTAIFEDGSTAEGNIILGCDSGRFLPCIISFYYFSEGGRTLLPSRIQGHPSYPQTLLISQSSEQSSPVRPASGEDQP